MALHKPCGCGPLVSSPALTPPSKTPMSTVIHILRPPLKPIFRNSAVKPPRATAATPHKYVYPDPIPQFAESVSMLENLCLFCGVDLDACLCCVISSTCLLQETQKFRAELSRRLLKEKEAFGHDLHSVVDVCAEVCYSYL